MLPLHQSSYSLDYQQLIKILSSEDNILVVQDLDGVCMGLVKDPLTRIIDTGYVAATNVFNEHFFVLTNGEHIGKRGVCKIIERAFGDSHVAKEKGLYLPGLAGGGVQWQDRYGNVFHPGVSDIEMAFLESIPQKMVTSLREFWQQHNCGFSDVDLENYIAATVLDNKVSPTVNLNTFYDVFSDKSLFVLLQQAMQQLTENLLAEAKQLGLDNSFFIHLAPNLGRDEAGSEIIQLATENDSGTTDFQFMLRGAIKESGIPYILNHYYSLQTGNYPLGKDFNSRQAPQNKTEILDLIIKEFEPQLMPRIIGVGDTVTSKVAEENGELVFRRGGSDRGFLELIQSLGEKLDTKNITVYVDSSGDELKNRKALKLNAEKTAIVQGIGDPRDNSDPLTLNVAFPGGHRQYIEMFISAAEKRGKQ